MEFLDLVGFANVDTLIKMAAVRLSARSFHVYTSFFFFSASYMILKLDFLTAQSLNNRRSC